MAYHPFLPANHHPIISLAQHLTSPLTASLAVFLVHKSWQRQAMLPLARAHALLRAPRMAMLGLGGALGTACTWAALEALPMRTLRADLYTWRTTGLVEGALRALREGTGLPWWATIVCGTLGLRMVLAPVQVGLLQNSLRLKLVWPEVLHHCAAMQGAQGAAAQREPARALLSLLEGARCSPFGQCLAFPILMPAAVLSVFGAVSNLCMAEPSMASEGTLFFPDLSVPDATQLLPILSSMSWLVNVEMGGVYWAAYPMARLAARLSAVAFIPLAEALPSGVLLFWLTSNCFAMGRGALLRQDSVRRLLRIPLQHQVAALKHLPAGRSL